MRVVTFLLFLSCSAFGREIVVGDKVLDVGKKAPKPARLADLRLAAVYNAKWGNQAYYFVGGYLTSHLPSRHYSFTITVSFWRNGGGNKYMSLGSSKIIVKNPEPGVSIPWKSIMIKLGSSSDKWYPHFYRITYTFKEVQPVVRK